MEGGLQTLITERGVPLIKRGAPLLFIQAVKIVRKADYDAKITITGVFELYIYR